jgi:hypothetical protein
VIQSVSDHCLESIQDLGRRECLTLIQESLKLLVRFLQNVDHLSLTQSIRNGGVSHLDLGDLDNRGIQLGDIINGDIHT